MVKKLFGKDIENDTIENLLNELQKFVNKLVKGVDVRDYTNASMLMERIMYEYGCFDGVLEYSGTEVDEYRSQIKFPKQWLKDRKSFVKDGEKLFILI